MTRLSIRLRVAAAFALAMALVLTGTGFLLYNRLGRDLGHALDDDLRLRAEDLRALVKTGPPGSLEAASGGRFIERGETFAQLLDRRGHVLDATTTLGRRPLLSGGDLARAGSAALFVDRPSVPGLDEPARLLATPVNRRAQRLVLIVGATRENRAEALRKLRTELLWVMPIALVLATGAGYLLAGLGLRAVEDMRRRAAQISAERRGERLPVPRTRDELERLGHTLNAMLGRLEAALERERGFVAEAGHELRTPLALVRAELDFALHHASGEEELRQAVRVASDETDRLVQLAGDLLLIASSDQGELRIRREPLGVRELLESVRNRFLVRSREDGRKLLVDAPDDLELNGDRLRLEQALGNLVDNALRHGAGPVHLEARANGRSVELHVRDEGRGFSEGFLPRAFERFSRPDDGRSGGGAGLGLSIVDAIARAHGGNAVATSDSQGADVWVAVPVTTTSGAPVA